MIFQYYVDGKKMYVINDRLHVSEEGLEAAKKKLYDKGYAERMAGYYDKWHRRYDFDEGISYDRGCMAATENSECPSDCMIIECNMYV